MKVKGVDSIGKSESRVCLKVITITATLCIIVFGLAPCLLAKDTGLDAGEVVSNAFQSVHNGWSSDEVLLQDELNKQFLAACRKQRPEASQEEFNWRLLNLRKAGKLKAEVTKRRRDDHTEYQHLAEVVARTMQDKFRVSTDRIMCDRKQRAAFDKAAQKIAPDVDVYLMRKAAFGLRKKRRLKPELVLRVAEWDRKTETFSASTIRDDFSVVPDTPGIYIFRDRTGYLYVGEAIDLRKRLKRHLSESDRQSLANYLKANGVKDIVIEVHAFPKDSRAKRTSIRRAYESELIASRKPRFNVRP